MPRYLMGVYLSCTHCDGLRTVGVLRSIPNAEDRTCFLLFEAPTSRAVMGTGERASLSTARVTEALDDSEGGDRS